MLLLNYIFIIKADGIYMNNENQYAIYDYSSFLPSVNDLFPNNRIMDFIVTGPFVLETDGSFEEEHMYEREKILREDYLAYDGGEKNILPVLGEKVKNNYYGKDYYLWEKGFIKWNCLRFDKEEDACDPALYATHQRNAVYYAAFYIDCEKEEKAVICYENSGSTLFVNGEIVDDKPFGRVKGLWDLGHQCLVHFRKGRNLVLFKLRPGYIADSMDISIANCSIFPCIAENNGLLITSPTVTLAYSGTKEAPRQIFPLFAAAEKDTENAQLTCCGETLDIAPMKQGEVTVLRPGIPDGTTNADVILSHANGDVHTEMYFITTPYDGFEGTERIISDFHFDTTYHQEQCTYALGAFHITKSIVERLTENPDFKATLSELDYLHPYYTLYPEHRQAIKQAFTEGRAEADCFYNQPNDLTSSGEAFVRNLAYGQIYHRDVLGRISTAYVPGDVFGHFSQITQVCKKGGCNYIKWGKMMLGTDSLFRHVSPDGSVLLHDKGFGRKEAMRLGVNACGASSEGVSNMEAVPREGNTDWMKKTVNKLRFSVFSELGNDVNKSVAQHKEDSPVGLSSRDLTRHHSGVLLTRTDFKQANRLCENLLVTAEKFSSIAAVYGAEYPELSLDKAWRQLLCAQHHDSVTGTNNEISFVDLMIQYRECAMTAAAIVKNAAKFIASGVKTADRKKTVFVFNPCTWERAGECVFTLPEDFNAEYGVLKDRKGKEYPLFISGRTASFNAPRIPAVGYMAFTIEARDEEPETIIYSDDFTIENARFRIDAAHGHGGGLATIYDKKYKRDYIDVSTGVPGNTINVLREIHDRMEPQHEFYTTGQILRSGNYPAEIKSEKCASWQKLKIKCRMDTIATVYQEITLRKNSDRIEFRTVIEDYNSEDDLFTVSFPIELKGGAVVFDDRFAPHVSTRSKKYMSFQTHQYASFSGCSVLPSNQWFGTGRTVVLDFGKVGAVNTGMTAVIREEIPGIKKAADTLLTALSKKGVPVTLYPSGEQHGGMKLINFREDIYQTDTRFVLHIPGDGNTYAEELYSKLNDIHRNLAEKRRAAFGTSVVYIRDPDYGYKKNVDVILITAENETELNNFIAEKAEELKNGYKIDLSAAVFHHIPILASEIGVSMLNNGNIACSVEGENTLNMMLFHTAAFYGNQGKVTGGKELVPEKKTHCFTYAFYPYKGSYREGSVYKEAFEYNDRLFAVTDTEDGENMFLPEENGFIKINGSFAATAFKAGGYPMAAMRKENLPVSERGLVLRGFETDGTDTKISIKTSFPIKTVHSSDLLEENTVAMKTKENGFSAAVGAHSIETYLITPGECEKIGSGKLADGKEFTKTTYARSWEYDMGSMPTGFLKTAAFLSRKPCRIDDTHRIIDLYTVNNSLDEDNELTVEISCTEGISTDKDSLTVRLSPEQYVKTPLTVTLDKKDRPGIVKISYEYKGNRFSDIYEFGYSDPEVTLTPDGSKLICKVKNPTSVPLEGSLYIASPFETWGLTTESINNLGDISPFCYDVEIAPGETKEYVFNVNLNDEGFFKAFWAAVKLCCNGRIYFASAEKHGPRHNVWAHEFIKEIAADNGSIRKMLDM